LTQRCLRLRPQRCPSPNLQRCPPENCTAAAAATAAAKAVATPHPTPLPVDRLIIVARDRQALDNARLLVDRFDEDGNIERVLVLNRRLVKEVKATKKRPMPAQVDDLNPHGRPPQETHNFTELLNVHAAGASAPARDATEDAVHATLEAQLEQPDEETGCISAGLLRALSMNVGEASTTSVDDDSLFARVHDVLHDDQQLLISAGGTQSTAHDIAAGSAVGAEDTANDTPGPFVEISGAVIAHLHTSTFIRLMLDVVRARQVLNILPATVELNPEQLTAIFRERHMTLHADKNVGKSKQWQEQADATLAQVVAACNLLRKHYHSTRHHTYRIADTSIPPAVAAGSTGRTADASIDDGDPPTDRTRTLTMAAPEVIAWCDQQTPPQDYRDLTFARWNQELRKWVWDQHKHIPLGAQEALRKERALSLIRHHAFTVVQDSSAAKGEADAAVAEGGSARAGSQGEEDAAAASAIQRDSSATARPGLGGHHGLVDAAGAAGGDSAVVASEAVPATGSEGAMPAALPTVSGPELQESRLLTVNTTLAPAAEAAAVATFQAVVDAPAARAASAGSTPEGAETQQEDTQHYAGIDGSTQAAMQPGTSRGL
jgi:hypothetical protein